MKTLKILLILSLISVAFAFSADGQSRTNRLYRPCPATSIPAVVEVERDGDININQCLGRTVSINGGNLANVTLAAAVVTDNAIIRGDGASRGVKTSLASVNNTGTVNVPDGQGFAINAISLFTYSSGTGIVQIGAGGISTKQIGATTTLRPNDSFTSAIASLSGFTWRPVVAPKTSAYSITVTEENTVYTNEGATAQINFNLPSAVAGMSYTFIVQDVDGIRVTAFTGDTIRIAATVSAAAGNIANAAIGSTVKLTAINATEWIAEFTTGTWVVT